MVIQELSIVIKIKRERKIVRILVGDDINVDNSSKRKRKDRAEIILLNKSIKNKAIKSISSSLDKIKYPITGPRVGPSVSPLPT